MRKSFSIVQKKEAASRITGSRLDDERSGNQEPLQVEWIDEDPAQGRFMQTRYYKSALEYTSFLDRNIMVTSIADDGEWFDSSAWYYGYPPRAEATGNVVWR